MTRTLTLKRASPLDLIHIPVRVLNATFTNESRILAIFDTGNDHTCIQRDVLDAVGMSIVGRSMPVHGVAGSTVGTVVKLDLIFEMDDGYSYHFVGHEVVVVDVLTSQCLLGRDILHIFDVELRRDGITLLKHG